MEFLLTKPWLSEIGLILDLIAFGLLSWDLVVGMRAERTARDDLLKVKRDAFNAHGNHLPANADIKRQVREGFDATEARIIAESERSMRKRRFVAYWAIGLATVGILLQVIGGWPTT